MKKLFVVMAVLLGGCGPSAQELAERAARVAAADEARCASYGFKKGTDEFARCRLELAKAHEATRAAVISAAIGRPVAPTHATCIGAGNTVNCNSY
jgi:hypothetical protein